MNSKQQSLLLLGLLYVFQGEGFAQSKTLSKPESKAKNTVKVGPATRFVNTKISINQANLKDLMLLPGVGAATAERIIEYRAKTKFSKLSDIKNVKGIGEKTYAKLKDRIQL